MAFPAFHVFNVGLLVVGPPLVTYYATAMSETVTYRDLLKAGVVYVVTAVVKLMCVATFLPSAHGDGISVLQDGMKLLIGMLDIAGLYVAFMYVMHGMSAFDKFQAIGLGWAFADTAVRRMVPLGMAITQVDFTWDHLLRAGEANVALLSSLSLAAVGMLLWGRRGRPAWAGPHLTALAIAHVALPGAAASAGAWAGWGAAPMLAAQAAIAGGLAATAWRLYGALTPGGGK